MSPTAQTIASTDGTRLYVQSWLPDGPLKAVVGVIPGWSDHGGRYMNLVAHLLPLGYGVLTMDLRGHGSSDGQRGHIMEWDEYRHDTDTFVRLLHNRYPDVPLFLFGHSLGGLAVMEYAIHHPDRPLCGVIASGPLLSPPNVDPLLRRLGEMLSQIVPKLSLNPGADPSTVSRDPDVVARYRDDPLGHDRATARFATEMPAAQQFVLNNLDAIQYPFLLVYGGDDGLVPPHLNREMFEKIGAADKTRHEYEGGYHEVINDWCKAQALRDIATWLESHTTK